MLIFDKGEDNNLEVVVLEGEIRYWKLRCGGMCFDKKDDLMDNKVW